MPSVSQVWPGMFIDMLPPKAHMSLQLSSSAGMFVMSCLPPGAHGATMTGTQGMGVSTPIAAAVAEATVGFASDVHMPNGIMLANGTKSMMVALGLFWIMGLNGTVTISVEGICPNVHLSIAPMHTYFGIFVIVLLVRLYFFFF